MGNLESRHYGPNVIVPVFSTDRCGRELGQGPNGHYERIKISDTFLIEWTEWRQHDGHGLPAALIGQRIMVAGSAHDGVRELPERFLTVTPEYATSEAAAVWNWSLGYGGVSGYRLRRAQPINLDQSVIDVLNAGHGHLSFGLDGVAE